MWLHVLVENVLFHTISGVRRGNLRKVAGLTIAHSADESLGFGRIVHVPKDRPLGRARNSVKRDHDGRARVR